MACIKIRTIRLLKMCYWSSHDIETQSQDLKIEQVGVLYKDYLEDYCYFIYRGNRDDDYCIN